MESRYALFALYALGAAVPAASLAKLKAQLELSKAKHRSLSGRVRMAGTVPIQPLRPRTPRRGTFVLSSSGVTLTDLDGNCFYDLTSSYGVNVFGCDFYKERIRSA